MKVELLRDSSAWQIHLTDRLGAGPRMKYIDTRYFCGTRASSRSFLQRDLVQTLDRSQVSASVRKQLCMFASLVF